MPLFRCIWAYCDGSGAMGGVSVDASSVDAPATFGTINAQGEYAPKAAMKVSAGLVPSGLITATSTANAVLVGFYPPGALTNATAVRGEAWSLDPFSGENGFTSPMDFYLIGAAWTSVERRE